MTNFSGPLSQFIEDFAGRRPDLSLRVECETDQPFLTGLFIACSPLANTLPQSMIKQQAWMQDQSYRQEFPSASRCIVTRGTEPIGRIIIDWDADALSHCIDVAMISSEQGAGIGASLLMAWITISDRLCRDSCLQVFAGSRAKNLYQRLGFNPVGDAYQPSITMIRPAGR